MPVLFRLLVNPRLLARFMRTKAGHKAALKYGTMLANSKTVQNSVKKLLARAKPSKTQTAYENKFNELQAKIEALQSQIDTRNATDAELQTATFTLGREVIEMRRLYTDMQRKIQQMRLAKVAQQHTR